MSDDDDFNRDTDFIRAPKRSEEPVRKTLSSQAQLKAPPTQARSAEAVILPSIILNVYIKFDKEQRVENLIHELLKPNSHLPKDANGEHFSTLHQYILESTREPIDMSNQNKRVSYQPNLVIKKNDSFGPWTFNYLLTLLSLEYQCDPAYGEEFPPVWKTDSKTKTHVNPPIKEYQTEVQNAVTKNLSKQKDDVTLEGFLTLICQQNQRNERNVQEWVTAFQGESIDTVEHLRSAVANEKLWDSIQSVKHIVKQMVKDYVQLNSPLTGHNQSNSIYQDSDATLYGDIHRIRRYFHYVTKTVQHITKLDPKAVDLAIVEIRKTYDDDGNVLSNIHAYLRTFCLQNRTLDADAHRKRRLEWMKEKNRLTAEFATLREEMRILEEEARGARAQVNVYSLELMNVEKEKQKAFVEAEKLSSEPVTSNRSASSAIWARQRDEAIGKMTAAENNVKDARCRLEEAQKMLAIRTEPISQKNMKIVENEEKIRDLDAFLQINGEESLRKLDVKFGRGLLLYGPPGTGKSELLKRAALFAGITMTTTALAAGELNRPYVGETERLLVDIMHRSHTIPYLICSMTIDEIDGLVPKRTNNAQQSKVDGISVLLSHIEGVKNIPNLIVLGATNRRNMMDEAFLRRMQAKCFVGRPSPETRKKMLEPLVYMDVSVFTNQMMNFLVKITTNFSGAAVGALKSSIIVAMDTHQGSALNDKLFLDLAHNAAKEFSCWFGVGTLPEICRLYPNIFSSTTNQQERYSLQLPDISPTGRILVDLQECKCLIELDDAATLDGDLDEAEKSTDTLFSRFINGCSSRNIDTIQIIDLNFLIKNNAFDENQIFEVLTTIFEECDEYNRSMLIFDIDSLIMLSVSDSAMSKSLSVSNIHLYQFIREKCKKAFVEKPPPDQVNKKNNFLKEKWVVMIVKHPLLRGLLVEDIEFKKTSRQIQQEYEDKQERLENESPKLCPKCEQTYVPSQVSHGSCRYHDGYVVDIDHPDKIITLEDAQRITQNARLAAANGTTDATGKPAMPKLFWSCCLTLFGSDQPCKTGVCGLPKELQERTFQATENLVTIVRDHFRNTNQEAKTKIAEFVKHYQSSNKELRQAKRPSGNSSVPPSPTRPAPK